MGRPRTKVFGAAVLLAACGYAASHGAVKTALDRYVAAPDSNYRFDLVKTIPGSGYTAFVLDMTSQSWRTPAEVDRPVWKHWLTIIKPDTVKGDTAFLFITGGSVNDNAPEKADPANVDTAMTTNTVVAVLNGVPNEPLTFNPKARDFRLLSIGPAYKGTPLTDRGGGVFVGTVANPPTGWTAFFLELTYPSGGKYPFKFTTAVRIVPDTLPFPPRALNVK
jgi:PhoPQ-activated pathogenicity-related protein